MDDRSHIYKVRLLQVFYVENRFFMSSMEAHFCVSLLRILFLSLLWRKLLLKVFQGLCGEKKWTPFLKVFDKYMILLFLICREEVFEEENKHSKAFYVHVLKAPRGNSKRRKPSTDFLGRGYLKQV